MLDSINANDAVRLEQYWNDIPVGKENAVTYDALQAAWSFSARTVRHVLHDLSLYDNGDNYILIRSSHGKGFYKTDDLKEIEQFRYECLSRGRNVFAPLKKINRVQRSLSTDSQFSFENNLFLYRKMHNLKQTDVARYMRQFDSDFDNALLSKMENSKCLPTFYQLSKLALLYGCEPFELINTELY